MCAQSGKHTLNAPRGECSPHGRLVPAVCVAAVLLALSLRIFGASDLFQNTDQGRTMAFTADAVLNGEWLLPHDLLGVRTLKPPLVNWVGAPFFAMGWHSEFALKLPSLLAGLATIVLTALAGRRLLSGLNAEALHPADSQLSRFAPALGIIAGAAWLASNSGLKHTYFLRPDMLMVALLTAGWLAAIIATGSDKPDRRWLLVMWTCAGLAALAKGPLAIVIPLYILLDTLARPRATGGPTRLKRLGRLGWWWGLPIMLAIPGIWIAAAWQVDPGHVRHAILGSELGSRIDRTTVEFDPIEAVAGLWRVPGFALERFAPWSALAVVGVAAMGRRFRAHPLRPAIAWISVVFLINLLDGGHSGSTNEPAYPAMAILAVYGLARLVAMRNTRRAPSAPIIAASLVLVVAAAAGTREAFFSRGARTGLGDRLKMFASQAERTAGDEAVVFLGTGHNPIPVIMGRTRRGDPSPDEFIAADWVVMPIDARFTSETATNDLRRLHADSGKALGVSEGIGLYLRETLPVSILEKFRGIDEPDMISTHRGQTP